MLKTLEFLSEESDIFAGGRISGETDLVQPQTTTNKTTNLPIAKQDKASNILEINARQ